MVRLRFDYGKNYNLVIPAAPYFSLRERKVCKRITRRGTLDRAVTLSNPPTKEKLPTVIFTFCCGGAMKLRYETAKCTTPNAQPITAEGL